MARTKRNSAVLDKARQRSTGVASIGKDVDFGNGLTVAGYGKQIGAFESQLGNYNRSLAQLDADANDLDAAERALRDVNERMLAAVGVRFGKDSNEYEMAGGVRKSERRRRRGNTSGNVSASVAQAA